jgi:hypothetical protein
MPKRWAIQVIFKSGDVAYLRHGSRIGAGPVATFSSRKTADINRDFIVNGLDAGDIAAVVAYRKGDAADA